VLFQEQSALRQDHHMAMRFLHIRNLRARNAQKVHVHADEGLVDNVQTGAGQQRMHVGHPAIGGILHREHPQIDLAPRNLVDHFLERGAGDSLEIRARLLAGLVRIGPKLSLKSDAPGHSAASYVENLPQGRFVARLHLETIGWKRVDTARHETPDR